MLDFISYVISHLFNPFTLFSDVISLFINVLLMIPPPFLILVALAVVIFIVRLIPL